MKIRMSAQMINTLEFARNEVDEGRVPFLKSMLPKTIGDPPVTICHSPEGFFHAVLGSLPLSPTDALQWPAHPLLALMMGPSFVQFVKNGSVGSAGTASAMFLPSWPSSEKIKKY